MNTFTTPPTDTPRKPTFPLPRFIVALAALAFVSFLIITPDGLLAKADIVGSAVCGRIATHSFVIAGRQLPLCARCTGTFIGALVGFFGQAVVLRRRRAAEFPPLLILVILGSFTLLWAADGVNSYITLIPNFPHLYEPQNWLRMTTGALNGLMMSSLVYPLFNFTLWRNAVPERTIRNLRDLLVLLLLEAVMIGLTVIQSPLLLYPLALLSALGVLTLLTCINSMLVVMIVRRENVVDNWREAIIPLLVGFTISLIMVGAINAVRYALIGTLAGIPSL